MSHDRRYDRMIPVSPSKPCPICGKPDWCLIAPDRSAAICPRVEEGAIKRAGDAGWLHVVDPNAAWRASTLSARRSYKPNASRDWSRRLVNWEQSRGTALDELAGQLGVSRESLERIGAGFDPAANWWTFPEKDSEGNVIGVLRRDRKGIKKRLPNSRCGLCYSSHWQEISGPILLVEGPSCTAAVLMMNLCGIGRPSNTGGVDHLVGMLEHVPFDRQIIVIGERDQQPDGKWPGREGAISTANQLAEALERTVAWSFPPDEAKDTRAWLQSVPKNLPIDRVADLFLSGLTLNLSRPIPLHKAPESSGPSVPLDSWRDAMRAARIGSLASPGLYLDASPTGSGKTHADLEAMLYAVSRGAG